MTAHVVTSPESVDVQLERAVVGIDFTSSSAAVWTARHLAPDAELVLVHAIYVPEPPRSLEHLYPPTDRLIDVARIGAEQQLRDLSRSLGAPRIWPEIRVGRPDEVVATVASEYTAGLIVIGPHAERPGGRNHLGSTAERVLWRATCPVLVARRMGRALPAACWRRWTARRSRGTCSRGSTS